MSAQPRPYRQVARAAATADTRRRLVDAFAAALRARWMEEITLDGLAAEAGTTRQTVIRLFGGKEGLLEAVAERTATEVKLRRALPDPATPGHIARVVAEDYEAVGDMILRLLAQEERYPVLSLLLDVGRRDHRRWVAETFAAPLSRRPEPERGPLLDLLVVATDVFTWKLLRHDRRLPPAVVEARMAALIAGLIEDGRTRHG